MTTTLALLRDRDRIVTEEGTPTLPFQNDWQKQAEEIEDLIARLNAAQATAQPDSTAATLAALVTDFNALLAKLRAAGLMAT